MAGQGTILHPHSNAGDGKRIAIVAARWHEDIVRAMLDSCMSTLVSCGTKARDIEVKHVPGTFEIPVAVAALIHTHRFDAIISLGVVVRGETAHFEYVAGPVAYALQNLSVLHGIPCIFGVLTTETVEQALERAGGAHGNKGSESAYVALEMASIIHEIQTGRHHA